MPLAGFVIETMSPGKYPADFPKYPAGRSPLSATLIKPSMFFADSAKTNDETNKTKIPSKNFFIRPYPRMIL